LSIAGEVAISHNAKAFHNGGQSMLSMRRTLPLLLIACSARLKAQEVKYIDLSVVAQRTELRHPPALPSDSKDGTGVGGGYGGASVVDGAPDWRDPHALAVYPMHVTPTDIDPTEPFETEFRVLNSGLAPIEIPVLPHLSDLQPSNESATFTYRSLALVVQGNPQRMPCVGFVELYGSPNHEDSMLVLRPGEWIGVRANVRFHSCPLDPLPTSLRGDFWLRRNTHYPHPGGSFMEIQNLYPNHTPTPGIAVHLVVRHLLQRRSK